MRDRKMQDQNFLIKKQDLKTWDWKMQDCDTRNTQKCFVTPLKKCRAFLYRQLVQRQ